MLRRVLSRLFWLLVALGAATKVVDWWTEAWWFEETGYSAVYLKLMVARGVSFVIGASVWGGILIFNLAAARRATADSLLALRLDDAPRPSSLSFEDKLLLDRYRNWAITGTVVLTSLIGGLVAAASPHFLHWQRFTNAVPTGQIDPIFGRDLSFYLFQLPALNFAWVFVFTAGVLALLLAASTYLYEGLFEPLGNASDKRAILPAPALHHLAALGAVLLIWKALGYRLSTYNLLTRQNSSILGIGYTDFHWRLPLLWVMMGIALATAVLLWRWGWRGEGRWALRVPVLYLLASWLIGMMVPALAQRLEVVPNEQNLEKPFLQHHIEWTRRAYSLDQLRDFGKESPASTPVMAAEVRAAMEGLPAWPPSALLDILNRSQRPDTSHQFADVDMDHYVINGETRPVLVAAREIAPARSRAIGWSTAHLQQTHGDSLVLCDANRTDTRGLPLFYRNAESSTATPALPLQHEEIFFGEFHTGAVRRSTLANAPTATNAAPGPPPFAAPRTSTAALNRGSEPSYIILNPYPTLYEERPYQGSGGVAIGARWRQWLLAWRFRDFRLAITPAAGQRSRILWHRRVVERCRQIAPFLSYEGVDPYPVLSEDGRIVWMLDIFSTSDAYPYAQRWSPFTGDNYIRHATTATVDAYDGTVHFYLSDTSDPFMQVYTRIFPGLFLPHREMPPDLRRHARYPAFLLALQAAVWGRYNSAAPSPSGTTPWELFSVNYATGNSAVQPGDGSRHDNSPASSRLVTVASLAREAVPDSPGPSQIVALLMAGSDPVDDPFSPTGVPATDYRLWQWRPATAFNVPDPVTSRRDAAADSPPPPALLAVAPTTDGIVYVHGSTPAATAGNNQSLSKMFGFDINRAGGSGTSIKALLTKLVPVPTDPLSTAPAPRRQYSKAPVKPPHKSSPLAAAQQQYRAMQQAKQRGDWAAYGEAEQRLGEVLGASH